MINETSMLQVTKAGVENLCTSESGFLLKEKVVFALCFTTCKEPRPDNFRSHLINVENLLVH